MGIIQFICSDFILHDMALLSKFLMLLIYVEPCSTCLLLQNEGGSTDGKPRKSGFEPRVVDASEYKPQVVELPVSPTREADDSGEADGSEDKDQETGILGGRGAATVHVAKKKEKLTDEDRLELWRVKLAEMRANALASMTEEEKRDFFKRLEV